jgi:hypothetical protein
MTDPPLVRADGKGLEERERKYLLDGDSARAFWAVASSCLLPQHDGDARPYAYVRTTYFDTPDLAYFRSCHGPIARRLRVREYAKAAHADETPVLADRCYLELKQSAEGMRAKTRVALRHDEVEAQLATLAGAPLAPCVATWYRRRALVDDATRLRVTLDERLLLCRPTPLGGSFGALRPHDVLGHGPPFVLEIKLSGSTPAWLASALGGMHEAVGFSKFMLGMSAIAAQSERAA